MDKKKLPEKVIREVEIFKKTLREEKIPLNAIYVFGSYAKGNSHKWSDIDVCVVSSEFKDPWDTLQFLWKKRPRNFNLTIEPVGFSPQEFKNGEIPLIHEIKKFGVVV